MKVITNTTSLAWTLNHGYGKSSDLFGCPVIPNVFELVSHKTGDTKIFVLDKLSPGYEDDWDGKYKMFISEDDEFQLTIARD